MAVVAIRRHAIDHPTEREPRFGHIAENLYVRTTSNDWVFVIGRNTTIGALNHPVWVCRIDHGPGTVPRYEERNFTEAELVPPLEAP
jgi:hypothetical protein